MVDLKASILYMKHLPEGAYISQGSYIEHFLLKVYDTAECHLIEHGNSFSAPVSQLLCHHN